MYKDAPSKRRITLPYLKSLKQQKQRFACITAYDYTFARLIDQTSIEVVLVGDSLGMVVQGHETTLPVTVEQMIYHGKAVANGLQQALLMLDMPFGSMNSSGQALDNATRLMQETGAQAIKLEGGRSQLETVNTLTHYGIPVCAHLGLQPQNVHKLGGYRVQGRDEAAALEMLEAAKNLEQAGADLLLLECVPQQLAAQISEQLIIPVIGIGAGSQCDAQILVMQDVLGITAGRLPRFSENFMAGQASIEAAFEAYASAVRSGAFPDAGHSFN